jgi:hypothetical protein
MDLFDSIPRIRYRCSIEQLTSSTRLRTPRTNAIM